MRLIGRRMCAAMEHSCTQRRDWSRAQAGECMPGSPGREMEVIRCEEDSERRRSAMRNREHASKNAFKPLKRFPQDIVVIHRKTTNPCSFFLTSRFQGATFHSAIA